MFSLKEVHHSDVIYSLALRSQRRRDKRTCCKVVFAPAAEKLFFPPSCFVVKYSMKSASVHSIATTNVIRIQVLLSAPPTHTHTHTLYHADSPCSLLVSNSNGNCAESHCQKKEASLMLWLDDTLVIPIINHETSCYDLVS